MSTSDTTPYRPGEDETRPSAEAAPLPADPFPGEYRLVRRLGGGAFGEVWLADDLSPLGWQVALKFLKLSADPQNAERALTVLRNEARLLAALRHPHIVQVHAWKQAPAGPPCLVLQYVPGGSLEDLVRRQGPLPWGRAARYVADVADGLALLHARGVIHRDVKPANLLLDPESDEALLTDFGIAARLAEPRTIAGTLRYMAPEAFRGDVSPELDVYSLAASLFALVAGEPPFDGDTPSALVARAGRGLDPADLRLAALPRELEVLLRAALAFRPGDRPALADFVRDLRGTLNQLLADCLTFPGAPPVDLRLRVSRQEDGRTCVPVSSGGRPEAVCRDMKRVPAEPARVGLRTGDRIRVEVSADRPGHVSVFNVGPTGTLNLLYPAEPGEAAPLLPAGQVLPVLDVELTPPTGRERLFALWTRTPSALRLDELRGLAGTAYRATRDMVRVQQSLAALPPQDRHAVVLELDHREA